jgi:hypothetical protein
LVAHEVILVQPANIIGSAFANPVTPRWPAC